MIVATLIVATGGAAFMIGGENEAPSLPEYGALTYTVRNNYQIQSLGEYGVEFHIDGDWYFSTVRWWYEDLVNDYEGLPQGRGTGDMGYLDTVTIETPWGTKAVDRYLGFLYEDQVAGMSVQYRGVDSDLIYRTDLIKPDYHIEVKLSQANFSSIWDLDLENTYRNVMENTIVTHSRQLRNDEAFIMGAGSAWTIFEPPKGRDYVVHFNSMNTSLYTIGGADISAMVEGHSYIYDEERSLIGNGSLEFEIGEGLTLVYIGQYGDGTPHGEINITILEE
ncbi:MAG: hypothetical protein NT131_03515 [Methanomassiliicoccales archaeon]|nr:hypothetical protein [Methanomassiliicoccales archaeon]